MKKFVIFISLFLFFSTNVFAEFMKAEVIKIEGEGAEIVAENQQNYQDLSLKILSGSQSGKIVNMRHGGDYNLLDSQKVKEGQKVVVNYDGVENYFISDPYRIPGIIGILIIFVILILIFAGLNGATSLLGLVFSILVLMFFIVPRIVAGDNPLIISIIGAIAISCISIYLAHGFNKRTSIALAGTIITAVLAIFLALLFVYITKLFGMGTEEAFSLQLGPLQNVNMRGLLLGGIIIGTLGVLDDITTAQAAAVDEIKKANPKLGISELYRRGLSVGKEHIVALVNTLVLAYAGAGMPLFLLFAIDKSLPLWVVVNNEFLAEEIVRTFVGSSALVFAVPITTFLAAYYYGKKS